jgi:GNAT superfamily N-acetyltransferase
MIDLRDYESLALESGAFKDIELDILKEILAAWQDRPGDPYTVLELRDGKILAGFAVICRESGTDYSFEARAFCVDRTYIGKGIAEGLLDMIEEEALRVEASAIIRVETSTKKEAAIGVGALSARSYAVMGHIEDFYEKGDDYYMYAKHIDRRVKAKPEEGGSI